MDELGRRACRNADRLPGECRACRRPWTQPGDTGAAGERRQPPASTSSLDWGELGVRGLVQWTVPDALTPCSPGLRYPCGPAAPFPVLPFPFEQRGRQLGTQPSWACGWGLASCSPRVPPLCSAGLRAAPSNPQSGVRAGLRWEDPALRMLSVTPSPDSCHHRRGPRAGRRTSFSDTRPQPGLMLERGHGPRVAPSGSSSQGRSCPAC